MTRIQIVLFKSNRHIVQKLIRWQTDSQYSHAALLFDGMYLIEAHIQGGVQARLFPAEHEDAYDVFDVAVEMSLDAMFAVMTFAYAQRGKKYDFWGCLRFISRRRLPENDKWFCSELVFEAFKQAGHRLLNNVESYQVSPGDLATSPYLVKVTT
jgi:uncharacterized protein YycO